MHKTIRLVVALVLFVLVNHVAFAQSVPARPALPATPTTSATTPPATNPAAASTPAAPTFTVTALSPTNFVSSDQKDLKREFIVRGKGLDGIEDVSFGDTRTPPAALHTTIVDNSSATTLKLSVEIPADTTGEYMLYVGGEVTKFKLTIKDTETDKQEKEAARQRALAAKAAAEAKKMKEDLAAVVAKVNALPAPEKTLTIEQVDERIAAALKANVTDKGSLVQNQLAQIVAEANVTNANVAELWQVTAENTDGLNTLAKNVQVKRGKLSHEAVDNIVARTEATLARLRNEGKLQD